MKKKWIFIVLCTSFLVGCGNTNISHNQNNVSEQSKTNDSNVDETENEELSSEKEGEDKTIIYNDLIASFLDMIKIGNNEGFIGTFPKELREDSRDIEQVKESCDTLLEIWNEQYGVINDIDYELIDEKDYDIETLKRDLENDIDVIEDMNMQLQTVLESTCNLQKCLELTMVLSIDGTKKSEQRDLKYFYIYQIDDQWYTDANALYKLEGYESAVKEYREEYEGAENVPNMDIEY